LIAALSVIRVDDNATEGGSKAVGFATAVIMTAVTIGPALMAEHILRLLAPAHAAGTSAQAPHQASVVVADGGDALRDASRQTPRRMATRSRKASRDL
jgi:hypothetical protein